MSHSAKQIVVSGGFDDLRSRDLRFLEEASRLGDLTVLLWPDETLQRLAGKAPKFPLSERVYLLNAIRYVDKVISVHAGANVDELPGELRADVWADTESSAKPARKKFCADRHLAYQVFDERNLEKFPQPPVIEAVSTRKKVIVTGCYDWFHSGHVRFFQEVSAYGDLYVIVGHDANIRLLKGEGHPLLKQEERRYAVGAVKYVRQALISSGNGWLDADPEIQKLKPDIYAVNEEGDRGGKREYCRKNGIEYLVLRRTPAPGLPTRSSTDLRGF